MKLLASAEDTTELTGVERLLCNLTKEEVSVYSLSQDIQNSGTEPVNYNHLPEHSVSRGLVGAIITAAATRREPPRHPTQHKEQNRCLSACLWILAANHGRPMPPLDWAFLEPFFPDAALRGGVTAVLARQAGSHLQVGQDSRGKAAGSGAGERHHHALHDESSLVVSVPPWILTTWLNKSLKSGLQSVILADNSGTTDLATMFSKIKAPL